MSERDPEIVLPSGKRVKQSQIKRLDELETNDLLKLIFISNQDVVAKMEAAVPKGETLQVSVTVTSSPLVIDKNYVMQDGNFFDPPYRKADLFNDGPNPVYFAFNNPFTRQQIAPIKINNMYVEDMVELKLKSLVVYTAAGSTDTAALRIFFKR